MKESYMGYKDILKGEYKEVFEKIEVSSWVENYHCDNEEREELLMQVLDSLVVAQEKGIGAKKVIGDNIERFCKNIFKKENNKVGLWEIFNSLRNTVIVIFTISLMAYISSLSTEGVLQWQNILISSSLVYLVIGEIGGVFYQKAIRNVLFKNRFFTAFRFYAIAMGLYIIILSISYIIGKNIDIAYRFELIAVVSFIYLGVYYAIALLKNRKHCSDKREINIEKLKAAVESYENRSKEGKVTLDNDEIKSDYSKRVWKGIVLVTIFEIVMIPICIGGIILQGEAIISGRTEASFGYYIYCMAGVFISIGFLKGAYKEGLDGYRILSLCKKRNISVIELNEEMNLYSS